MKSIQWIEAEIAKTDQEIAEMEILMAEYQREFSHETTECGVKGTYQMWSDQRRRRDDARQYRNVLARVLED